MFNPLPMNQKFYQSKPFWMSFLSPATPAASGGLRRQIHVPACAMLALLAMFVMAQTAGAASYTWNAIAGTSANTNWSTPGNWTLTTGAGGPLATDTAVFGNVDTVSSPSIVNNYVDSGFAGTIAKVWITNSAPSSALTYHVTQIPTEMDEECEECEAPRGPRRCTLCD